MGIKESSKLHQKLQNANEKIEDVEPAQTKKTKETVLMKKKTSQKKEQAKKTTEVVIGNDNKSHEMLPKEVTADRKDLEKVKNEKHQLSKDKEKHTAQGEMGKISDNKIIAAKQVDEPKSETIVVRKAH